MRRSGISGWFLLGMFAFMAVGLAAGTAKALDGGRAITQYSIDTWSTRNGLPSASVLALAQTPEGYIWVATPGGISRFDGMSFTTPVELQEALKSKVIIPRSILVSRDGSLWISLMEGLCRVRGSKVELFEYTGGPMGDKIYEASDGSILIAAYLGGMIRFKDGTYTRVPQFTDILQDMHEDRQGNIWLAGMRWGLYCLKPDGSIDHYGAREGLPDLYATSVCQDRTGAIWVGSRGGASLIRNGKFTNYSKDSGLTDNNVNCILEDSNGFFWIGTSGGLNRMKNGAFDHLFQQDGLSDNNISCLMEDREGCLWIGTSYGLSRLKDGKLTPFTTKEGLGSNKTATVTEGRDGSIWVFSDGAGLSRLKDGRFTRITAKDGLASDYGGPLYEAADGSIWVGTANGVSRIRDGRVTSYSEGPLSREYVSALIEHGDSMLLFISGRGAHRLKDGKCTPYEFENGFKLGKNHVFYAFRSRDGMLWLGTNIGLARIGGGQDRLFTIDDGLPANTIASIFEDSQGAMWFGTETKGAARLKDGVFSSFSVDQGLPDNRVSRILEDNNGDMWMSCPRGIIKVSRQELDDCAGRKIQKVTSTLYDTADGMKSNECSITAQPDGCKSRDGRLWFPTRQGIVMADPASIRINNIPPPVIIDKIVVDGRTMFPGQEISLAAGAQRIIIQFNGLSLQVPERVMFKYRLVGFDKDWVDSGGRRMAYYTRVPPGKYRFQVMACNNDGVWSKDPATLEFTLRPYFYQTYWFYGLCLLVLLFLLKLIHDLRVRSLKAREAELKVKVDEAVAKVKVLSGMLPICSGCKKIRDDTGYWNQIESFIRDNSEAQFSHSFCPECMERLFPELKEEEV